jgi:Tfp pilus assembly pilus retraction ATPase PilT
MAGGKPFKKDREYLGKAFQKNPGKVFKKRGTIADILRIIQGQTPPFKKLKNGGTVKGFSPIARPQRFKGVF